MRRFSGKSLFRRVFLQYLFCFVCGGAAQVAASAATLDVRVEIVSAANPSRVRVEGKIVRDAAEKNTSDRKKWIFADAYADASNLSERFSGLAFFDEAGRETIFRKTAAGEYRTEKPAHGWSYEANLAAPSQIYAAAHVSWLTEQRGLLMLADLLPQFAAGEKVAARVRFVLPADWRIATAETKNGTSEYQVADVERAIFLIGKDFRERTGWIGKTEFRAAIVDGWTFADEEIVKMATQILEEHRRAFGELANPTIQLVLLPFPRPAAPEKWRAETRGSTIVLLSGVYPFKSAALNRLHEQLRHELFHLWIPNALALSGQYDWFYEGFTLYQALKIGVRLKYIRFEDFLDVIGRAFDASRSAERAAPSLSLLAASRERWRGGSDLVYAKGMVVAFLCDVALLRESNGKRSLAEVFRQLYKKHRLPAAPPEDGNQAIIEILKTSAQASRIVARFVESAERVEWTAEIAAGGLQNVSATTTATKLIVGENLNGKQKKLLEKLGYEPAVNASIMSSGQ